MQDALIEVAVSVLVRLIAVLLGVLGAWLTAKLAKRTELANINAAQSELIRLAQLTVEELQQTIVDDIKAAHCDGKLTKGDIERLGAALLALTREKMSEPSIALLTAAGVDIDALITGAGEGWIAAIKANTA